MTVNPLKKSAVIGSTTAALGFDQCIPVHHGSQGCTAFIKNIMTQHYREIVPMQTTAVYNISAIMGSYSETVDALYNVITKTGAKFVPVITTGLTQVRGDDLRIAVTEFRKKHKEFESVEIIPVEVSDLKDEAETGFISTLEAIIDSIEFTDDTGDYVLVIPNFSLTPGDVEEIKDIILSFGLKVVVFSDLSETLGGINNFYYKITQGGTKFQKTMSKPLSIVGIGGSTKSLTDKFFSNGYETRVFNTLTGIKAMDDFLDYFYLLTGKKPSEKIIRQRNRLIDSMLDSHFYLNNIKVGIGAEPDLLFSIKNFLGNELGIEILTAVTTYKRDDLDGKCIVGDLADLERNGKDADIIMTNSNGALITDKFHNRFIKIGFPVKDEIGYTLEKFVGYTGSMNLCFKVANMALDIQEEKSYHYKKYKGVKYESCIL